MKKTDTKNRIKLLLSISMLCVACFTVAFAKVENVNTLSIGNSSVITGRYFCTQDLAVIAHYTDGDGFTNCQYGIKFNPLNESISYVSRGGFSDTDATYLSGSVYYVEEKNDNAITSTVTCSTIRLNPNTTNMTSTYLSFVDLQGNDPDDYTFTHTDDKLNLAYDGSDTLTGVQNLTINYEICPCNLDQNMPQFSNFSHDLSNSNLRLTGQETISFLVYDKGGTSWSHWSSGRELTLANYTSIGLPAGMDNQEGINSGTITVVIEYSGYGVSDDIFTINNGLVIQRYTGTISGIPEYTWDGNDRGYWVSFTPSTGFRAEMPVKITISASDNVLNQGSLCTRNAKSSSRSYTVHQRQAPAISMVDPLGGTSNLNPRISTIKFHVSDSRAGVDTGSVTVTIPAIYSGSELLMTGYTYSGSELYFSDCTGTPEIGGAYSCDVEIEPKREFPVNSTINITGYVKDLADNGKYGSWNISTRQSCLFYGCVNYVQIYMSGSDIPTVTFTGSLIVVTGSIYPYPFLTGENNDIVMCGPVDDERVLSGNIDIYSGDDVINGTIYGNNELYVTGLNFEYESGIITVLLD